MCLLRMSARKNRDIGDSNYWAVDWLLPCAESTYTGRFGSPLSRDRAFSEKRVATKRFLYSNNTGVIYSTTRWYPSLGLEACWEAIHDLPARSVNTAGWVAFRGAGIAVSVEGSG